MVDSIGSARKVFAMLREKNMRQELCSPTVSSDKELILVVEDDRWVRSFLGELLAGFGYRIIEAEDALEALEKFEESAGNIALVLCDMVLPNMNGRELCQKLVDSCRDLKVLFMSGYPVELIRSRGIDTDEITILLKPFKPEELLHAVRSTLTT
jgi:CheY-like chemotaxis protein